MIYNPLDKYYKNIIGACSEQDELEFRVKGNFGSVLLIFKSDKTGEEFTYLMEKKLDCFYTKIKLPVGLYFYYFKLDNGLYISCGKGLIGHLTKQPVCFQLTVYKDYFVTPNWVKGGLIYQIFPDRFNKSLDVKKVENGKVFRSNWGEEPFYKPDSNGEVLNNDFFGGDLLGIINKLDYIKSLGANILYLNPIFKAYSNHRYDTANYMEIDSLLGDTSDLLELCNECHKRNMYVVLDGVFNHVGADSIYFNKKGTYNSIGAYQSKESPYFDWFNFYNYPDGYDSWWGIKTLPSINEKNKAFIDYITGENGVVAHYLKLGVDGWRLDVVDELPSCFVKAIRKSAKSAKENSLIIGEVWEDASNKIAYDERREYFLGDELDSVMNYPLKNAIIDFVNSRNCDNLVQVMLEQIDHYPSEVLHSLMNILSTHDTFRIISALSSYDFNGKTKDQLSKVVLTSSQFEEAFLKVKIASLIQYTACGTPSLYYGEEAGMEGFMDPFNRGCYPWGVEKLDVLNWYKFLGKLRNDFSVFKDGNFEIVYANGGKLIYTRKNPNCQLLIAINISSSCLTFNFNGSLTEVYSDIEYINKVELQPNSFGIFYKIS